MFFPKNNLATIELLFPLSASYGLLTFPYVGLLGIWKIILGVSPLVRDFGKYFSRLWENGGTPRLRAFG